MPIVLMGFFALLVACSAQAAEPSVKDLLSSQPFPKGAIKPSDDKILLGTRFASGDDLFAARGFCLGGAPSIQVDVYSASTLARSGHFDIKCADAAGASITAIASSQSHVVVSIPYDVDYSEDPDGNATQHGDPRGRHNLFVVAKRGYEIIRRSHLSNWVDLLGLDGESLLGCGCNDPAGATVMVQKSCQSYDLRTLRERAATNATLDASVVCASTPTTLAEAEHWNLGKQPDVAAVDFNGRFVADRWTQSGGVQTNLFFRREDEPVGTGRLALLKDGFEFDRLGEREWQNFAIVTKRTEAETVVGLYELEKKVLTPLFSLANGQRWSRARGTTVGKWLIAYNNDEVVAYEMGGSHRLFSYEFGPTEKDSNDNGTPWVVGHWIIGFNWVLDVRTLD